MIPLHDFPALTHVGRLKNSRRALEDRSSSVQWLQLVACARTLFSHSRLKDEIRCRAGELKEWTNNDGRRTPTRRALRKDTSEVWLSRRGFWITFISRGFCGICLKRMVWKVRPLIYLLFSHYSTWTAFVRTRLGSFRETNNTFVNINTFFSCMSIHQFKLWSVLYVLHL